MNRVRGGGSGAAEQISQKWSPVLRQKSATKQRPKRTKRWPANASLLSQAITRRGTAGGSGTGGRRMRWGRLRRGPRQDDRRPGRPRFGGRGGRRGEGARTGQRAAGMRANQRLASRRGLMRLAEDTGARRDRTGREAGEEGLQHQPVERQHGGERTPAHRSCQSVPEIAHPPDIAEPMRFRHGPWVCRPGADVAQLPQSTAQLRCPRQRPPGATIWPAPHSVLTASRHRHGP